MASPGLLSRADCAAEMPRARTALVETLRSLPAGRWDEPSLCDRWRVRDVVAHVIRVDHYYTSPRFWTGLVRHGLRLGTFLADDAIALTRERADAELLADLDATRYEERRIWKMHPWPVMALGELVIHGQDIRRALGIPHTFPETQLRAVADLLVLPRRDPFRFPWGAPTPPTARLEATDVAWTHGDGPLIMGALEAIIMAVSGRVVAVRDLSGDGVGLLRGGGR